MITLDFPNTINTELNNLVYFYLTFSY